MWSAEIMARTIGAAVRRPALAEGRHPDRDPYWGLATVGSFPASGSALVVWDSGAAVPPTANTPPRAGRDPHEDPRAAAANRAQKYEFLFGEGLVEVCGSAPCRAEPAG
jgi:hypothetical protein